MNAIEAQLLQRNIQGLGDAFENRAVRKEQARQFDLTRDDRLRQFSVEEELKRKQLEGTASVAANKAQADVGKIANRVWDDTVKMHGDWVKDGIMKPDVALKSLQTAISKIPPEAQTFLSSNPNFASIQSGEFSFQTPQKAPPSLTPTTVGGRKGLLTPGGALHFEDTLSPVDKIAVEDINRTLREIEKQAIEMAGKPNVEKSRALRAARESANAKKASILAKYSGGTAPQPQQPAQPAQEAVPEAPKQAAARQAGAVYQTPKGALKWTGTGWIQP